MLDRDRVIEAFKTALAEFEDQFAESESKPSYRKIADHAREVFCRNLAEKEKAPSLSIFRSYLFGKRSKDEIVRLVEATRATKMVRLERGALLAAFRAAIEFGRLQNERKLQPRTIAVMAHRFYCEALPDTMGRPSLVSFTRRVKNKSTDPEILDLLKEAGIESKNRARLDRERLKEAFGECIRKFENRILRGIAKPIHVADSAHKIYVEGLDSSEQKPSRSTFRRMIYGQDADPEIASLLVPHFPSKK